MAKNKKEENYMPEKISAVEYATLSPEERADWTPLDPKLERIPLFCKISLTSTLICAVIYAIACLSERFADFFNINVSSVFRMAFGYISGLLPFSIAEMVIILIPVILVLVIWYILKYRSQTWKSTWISVLCMLSVLSLFFSVFVLNFGTGYKGTSLDKKLELDEKPVSAEELYLSAVYLADKTNELADEIYFSDSGSSYMPYAFDEMNDKLIAAYDSFCEGHDFINNFNSRLKPVMLSDAMSYTHITGVYSFFTGEANINVCFPDYTIPFTAAHELAHQRGIAREDEANMIAFLVCIGSDDDYIQYSAYLNMYEYISNALYSTDRELYYLARGRLNSDIINEQIAYSTFFDKYRDSVTSQVSGTVNDTYLKIQGTEGSKSYGMVVDLTIAYFISEGIIAPDTAR